MKKFFSLFIAMLTFFVLCSCGSKTSAQDETKCEEPDSIAVEFYEYKCYQGWFTEFEKKNPNWMVEEDGLDQLKKSFEDRILTDGEFTKSLISNASSYSSNEEYAHIVMSESLAPANTKEYAEGELKAFLMSITVKLIKPLYNGQRKITLYYEVINFIPAVKENHDVPYCGEMNNCVKSKTPYFKNELNNKDFMGSYIITIP